MRSLKRPTHETTEDQERGSQGAYAPDSSICVLGAERTSIHLLPRGEECTRVYTVVYPRVHNCIHACTLPRSQYVPSGALWYVSSSGLTPRRARDTAGASLAMKYYTKGVKEGGY